MDMSLLLGFTSAVRSCTIGPGRKRPIQSLPYLCGGLQELDVAEHGRHEGGEQATQDLLIFLEPYRILRIIDQVRAFGYGCNLLRWCRF
jgi:hypothetical protein